MLRPQHSSGRGWLPSAAAARILPACTIALLVALPASAQNERAEIGGACTSVTTLDAAGVEWALYNFGSHLRASRVAPAPGRSYSIEVEGFIRDIEVVDHAGRNVALLATGGEGIVAIDVTDPSTMTSIVAVTVNYYKSGLTWTEGGGDILYDNIIFGRSGSITALATDGVKLWIANEDFGLHSTALDNLIGLGGPTLESDGTLLIENEVYTLQYAGENPWGGPRQLALKSGRLFAALGFLGMGIFDPVSLEQVGGYNLYTDASTVEDWFIDMDVAQVVQPGFLDPFTGMPDYRQASFEIIEVWHGGVEAPTPWADFDRYGRYYYNTNAVAVAQYGDEAIAYVACGLGGLVAVDVKGFYKATSGNYVQGTYLGYAPAVPAHGPDEPTQVSGPGTDSLFPHYGAGMLKEAGAVGVAVHGTEAYYTDHFAGLTVLSGADNPAENWHGPDAPYDNDDPNLGSGVLGDHWPDYEFVTSYDMNPHDPTDHESLPTWMFDAPCALVSGEIGGHAGALAMLPGIEPYGVGIDLVVGVGAGGMNYLDVVDLTAPVHADRWYVAKFFPTTNERGALADGVPAQTISIGHSQGVTASERFLYLADGPHGVTAWRINEPDGSPSAALHVVANTLQDEYPQDVAGTTVYPTPHAYGVVYDDFDQTLYVLCQGLGMRRVDVSAVEKGLGDWGIPLLLAPQPTDIFEHNTEHGSVDGTPKQDHAYDMVREGDLAFVADGGNGLTIYDLTKDPTDLKSGFVVSNLGGSAGGKAELGRSTGITLWYHPVTQDRYVFLAAGPRGVGVVEATDPTDPVLVKVFEPIKIEDGKVGHADGRAVDVLTAEGHAFFSYDSFGVVCYSIADLIAPLPAGVDPTEIWKVQAGEVLFDYRPVAVSRFRLQDVPGYSYLDAGGALNMVVREEAGAIRFYIAYGVGGVGTILWTDPAAPQLLELRATAGEAASVVEHDGRIFVADGAGGLVSFD